jgi:hypothetical protein
MSSRLTARVASKHGQTAVARSSIVLIAARRTCSDLSASCSSIYRQCLPVRVSAMWLLSSCRGLS